MRHAAFEAALENAKPDPEECPMCGDSKEPTQVLCGDCDALEGAPMSLTPDTRNSGGERLYFGE